MGNSIIKKIYPSGLGFYRIYLRGRLTSVFSIFKIFTILYFFAFSESLQAHPVSFEGGTALMSEMSPVNQELSITYSPKWWLGTGIIFDRNTKNWELTSLHLAFLAKRWNLPEAQGNFYLFGGPGFSRIKQKTENEEKSFYRMGIQADFETRRIYFSGRFIENRLFSENEKIYNRLDLTSGFAPYLADFDELNSWVLLRIRTNISFHDPLTIMMIRFFYRNFLWELGQDFNGNSHLNFMIRFLY